jgi:hypothetical protein
MPEMKAKEKEKWWEAGKFGGDVRQRGAHGRTEKEWVEVQRFDGIYF